MGDVRVYHYNAFSTDKDKGNPAGVVFDGEKLSDQQMIEVAKQVGFNETAFVLESNVADLRLRYFTPGHEINLCGHATVASLYGLRSRGLLSQEDVLLPIMSSFRGCLSKCRVCQFIHSVWKHMTRNLICMHATSHHRFQEQLKIL